MDLCNEHTSKKPPLANIEFLELANIIMEEEDWPLPTNCEEALILFLNLVHEIQ